MKVRDFFSPHAIETTLFIMDCTFPPFYAPALLNEALFASSPVFLAYQFQTGFFRVESA